MVHTFQVPLTVATVASILTICEFVIGTLAVIALTVILFGSWILKLHHKKQEIITIRKVETNSLIRKLSGILLGAWFATSVGMFERGLQDRAIITKRQHNVSSCVRLDHGYDSNSYLQFNSPLQYEVDDVSMSIAKDLNCLNGNIVSIDFGSKSRTHGEGDQTYSPLCQKDRNISNEYQVAPLNGTVNVTVLNLGRSGSVAFEPTVEIFPYNLEFFNRSRHRNCSEPYVELPNCKKHKISSWPIRHFRNWGHSGVDDYSVALSLQNELCDIFVSDARRLVQHPISPDVISNPVTALDGNDLLRCLYSKEEGDLYFFVINAQCLRNRIIRRFMKIYEKTINNVSVLITKTGDVLRSHGRAEMNKSISMSSVCLNTSVKVRYVFVKSGNVANILNSPTYAEKNRISRKTPHITQKFKEDGTVELSDVDPPLMTFRPVSCGFQKIDIPKHEHVLLPVQYEVSGTCVPTIYGLARASLIHSHNAEWGKDRLRNLGRTQRFWAYAISFSRFLFVKSQIGSPYSTNHSKANDACLLNAVRTGTEFKADIWFYSLCTVSIVGTLISITGLFIRVIIPRYAWNVPYYGWYFVKQQQYFDVGGDIYKRHVEEQACEYVSNEDENDEVEGGISKLGRVSHVMVKVIENKENKHSNVLLDRKSQFSYSFHALL